MTRYIFVTGGVVSGLGKGITAASLGRLLKNRGYRVTLQKIDPYLNIDPGTMNPTQHGEVFVTDDGAETDLDLGHYERFIDESLTRDSSVTSGIIHSSVLENERQGKYNGQTVQVIPHITNEIKRRITRGKENVDIAIIEVGGTVGDIEGLPVMEAVRQLALEIGHSNCIFLHLTLVPYLKTTHELKTKPTQHSVKQLLSIGIQPDILVCRTEYPLGEDNRQKISLFCNLPYENVIENRDVDSLYEVPLELAAEGLDVVVLKRFGFTPGPADLTDWRNMVDRLIHPEQTVRIALVGKYVDLHDSYYSVVEALKHGGIDNRTKVEIVWVDAEEVQERTVDNLLQGAQGVLVPGGFGSRGIEGMILAARYARERKIPYLGICLGMHVAVIEFARNVLGYADAHSTEVDPQTTHPLIDLMPGQQGKVLTGGTMRLGQYPCHLQAGSLVAALYPGADIAERHRHRYEFNNNYRPALQEHGMRLAGLSPDGTIVEIVELQDHPFFIGIQFHPEFKSRPTRPHPLFSGLVRAALEYAGQQG